MGAQCLLPVLIVWAAAVVPCTSVSPPLQGQLVVARNEVDLLTGISFVDMAQCQEAAVDILAIQLWAALDAGGGAQNGCLFVFVARPRELECKEHLCGLVKEGQVFEVVARSAELCGARDGPKRFLLQPPLRAGTGDCLGWQYSGDVPLRVAFSRGGDGLVWWLRSTPTLGEAAIFQDKEARSYSMAIEVAFAQEAPAEAMVTTQSGCARPPELERFFLRAAALFRGADFDDPFEPMLNVVAGTEPCDKPPDGTAAGIAAALLAKAAICAIKEWHAGRFSEASVYMDTAIGHLHDCAQCLDQSEWPLTSAQVLSASLELVRRGAMRADRARATSFWPSRPLLAHSVEACPSGSPSYDPMIPFAVGPSWGALEPRLACLVTLLVPQEVSLAEAIARTWGLHCDALVFFTVLHDTEVVANSRGSFHLVNLAEIYPQMQGDSLDLSNAAEKALHTLRWAAEHLASQAEVLCLFGSDTFVLPENVRWLARERGLGDGATPQYLAHLNDATKRVLGVVMPFPESDVCFTREGLLQVGEVLELAPYRHWELQSWEDAAQECMYVTGLGSAVVLRSCTMLAGVDPLDAYDEFGRLFSSSMPLPCRGHWSAQGLGQELERLEGGLEALPEGDDAALQVALTEAELARYLVCRPHSLRHWLHPYAYAFHGYKDAALMQAANDVVRRADSCDWLVPHWHPRLAPALGK